MIWKLGGVALGVAVAGILIGFYVANWLLSGPPTYDAQTSHSSANITIQTVAAVGPQLSPNPDWVSYLSGTSTGDVGAQHRLDRAGARARARDRLPVRRRQRPAQPVPRPGRRASSAARCTVDGKTVDGDQPGRRLAHVRDPAARRARAARRASPTTPRTSAATRRAPLDEAHRDDHLHASAPASRARTAGSASCRARPASSTASAGRCRRSATWTASSTWSERDDDAASRQPRQPDRCILIWLVLSVIATPIVVFVLGPRSAAGQRRASRRRARSSTTRSCSASSTPIVVLRSSSSSPTR